MGKVETCCQQCGKSKKLYKCDKCQVVSYCSQTCRTADAECHGRVCFKKTSKKTFYLSQITNILGSFLVSMDDEYFTKSAVLEALYHFRFHYVVTEFQRIPHSDMDQIKLKALVILAQISETEEDSRNIFIKDILGRTLYVIFNLTASSLKWSKLIPDRMICIKNPVLYTFAGQLVLCISNKAHIKVL